ncbi:hypothetical protein NLJ89_g1689 [Agrocybe chaxingu]|uniref:Tyrosinase copper-binding domain-containing protein n=1 Tax=Agrocybe chaxingu TaxID=84603 RepID=A0A9W8MZJ6_9AGAR|nr:hypothetical protein NLJ89_g1689 [Agrocybe chaxingu]
MRATIRLLFHFLALLNIAAVVQSATATSPDPEKSPSGKPKCSTLLRRKEWRTLSNAEKKNYIDAVKCLQSRPAVNPAFPEAQSRYEEFQAYHMLTADFIHAVGHFLPWHRRYVQLYDRAMRKDCGYKGATPYWDWSQDADDAAGLTSAPVWDPVTGFGGNGVPGTYTLPTGPDVNFTAMRIFPASFVGCVQDGPFANHTLRLGPGTLKTTHCLVRGINAAQDVRLNSKAVAWTLSHQTFEDFRIQLEGQPFLTEFRLHDGGHNMIGGDMSNFYSSPGEPLFYLHHGNVDRIWWQWQQMLPSRLYEVSGRSTTTPPFRNITLDFIIEMGESLGPSVPIRDVMDIHSPPNCYTYV